MCLPEAFSALQWFVGERTFRRHVDRPQDSLGLGDKPCVQSVEVAGLSKSCSGAREAGLGGAPGVLGWAALGGLHAAPTAQPWPRHLPVIVVTSEGVPHLGETGSTWTENTGGPGGNRGHMCHGQKPIR